MSKKINLFEGRTKEWNSDDWQGKEQKQIENTYKIASLAAIGLFVFLIGYGFYEIVMKILS